MGRGTRSPRPSLPSGRNSLRPDAIGARYECGPSDGPRWTRSTARVELEFAGCAEVSQAHDMTTMLLAHSSLCAVTFWQ